MGGFVKKDCDGDEQPPLVPMGDLVSIESHPKYDDVSFDDEQHTFSSVLPVKIATLCSIEQLEAVQKELVLKSQDQADNEIV